jgi:hypothetical protein
MSRSRIVPPATTRLELTEGDWVDVKAALNYGDAVAARAMLVKEIRLDGRVTPDFQLVEVAQVLAYLVDWSFIDAAGKKIPIETAEQKRSALFALDEATVRELTAAIGAHAERVEAERVARKNGQSGEIPSSTISSFVA